MVLERRARLDGRRVLIVGASSGIGRATGLAIAAEGGRVALAARRADRLEAAAAEAGGGAIALQCDVTDAAACAGVVASAAEAFGGLDAIVYAPGIGTFKAVEDLGADDWRAVLDTNLVGASLVMSAALPHLAAARGKAVFLGSIAALDAPPRPFFASYVVSKVALETLVEAWQGEHREIAFTTIAIGDTLSEYGTQESGEIVGPIVQRWVAEGYLYGRVMQPESVAEQVVNVLASAETVRRISITPSYPSDGPGATEMFERAKPN